MMGHQISSSVSDNLVVVNQVSDDVLSREDRRIKSSISILVC